MSKLTAKQKKEQAARVATYHFYVTTEIFNQLPEKNVTDFFCVSEEVFVQNLYEYTYLFCEKVFQAESLGWDFPENMPSCSADSVADWFWGQVNRYASRKHVKKMPDFDEFELDVERVLEEFRIN